MRVMESVVMMERDVVGVINGDGMVRRPGW